MDGDSCKVATAGRATASKPCIPTEIKTTRGSDLRRGTDIKTTRGFAFRRGTDIKTTRGSAFRRGTGMRTTYWEWLPIP